MEYFGAETFTDEDPHNSKPISYKYKLFREMNDQLDRLLKKFEIHERNDQDGEKYCSAWNIPRR